MKHWISDVVACSDGTEVSPQASRKLKDHNIPLRPEPIQSLEDTDRELTKELKVAGPVKVPL